MHVLFYSDSHTTHTRYARARRLFNALSSKKEREVLKSPESTLKAHMKVIKKLHALAIEYLRHLFKKFGKDPPPALMPDEKTKAYKPMM